MSEHQSLDGIKLKLERQGRTIEALQHLTSALQAQVKLLAARPQAPFVVKPTDESAPCYCPECAVDARDEPAVPAILIPPCSGCQFWRPEQIVLRDKRAWLMCHRGSMRPDFSCFQARAK